MKKIPILEHSYSEVIICGIGDRNTVSNGSDNGANNCMASRFWKCKRHGSTAHCVDNLLIPVAKRSVGAANVGGHGNEGLLETGTGQNGNFDTNKIILTWNESVWGRQMDRIAPTQITMMSIYSCHTGAGEDGADLLFAIARHIGRAVRGRTGFTYCGSKGITFEKGSLWQVATPTHRPDPIQPPSPHMYKSDQIVFQVGKRELGLSQVTELTIDRVSLSRVVGSPVSLAGRDAKNAVAALFYGQPLEVDAAISGMITAALKVTFRTGDTLELQVYNDRLAVDTKSKTGYYISTGFGSLALLA